MARDHSTRRYVDKGGPASGMHLFDFNQTLSGKRLSDERKITPDDRLYKGRGSPNSRAKNEEGEIFLSSLRTSDKRMNYVHGGSDCVSQAHGSKDNFRAPNVVARLMGLDTIPNEALPATQAQAKKKWGDQLVAKQAMEKPSRKKNEMKQSTVVMPGDDKARLYHARYSDDRRQGSPKELPDLFELEEMKRQLAVKQMLVREKLNEAKRLLTGEKISDKRWVAANQKLNQSKEFLDAIDFFQTNRDAFLKYVDDQDSVLGKHIEKVPGNVQRHSPTLKPVPEGLRNPIVRKVIESRREDARKNTFAMGGGDDAIKNLVADNQAPTRIVVLKPSPNRSFSPTPATFSPGPYIDLRDDGVIPSRRLTDVSRDDEGNANPREIAKEIARQVRESVVRDLARNASGSLAEQGAGKRLTVPLDNSEGPRLDGGCDYFRGEAVTTPTGKGPRKQKLQAEPTEDTVRRISHSSQKKPSRPRQQVSGSSPPLSRPASKGIVVLVPDQSVSKIQSREIVSSSSTIKQPIRKDRIRRSQQVLPEMSHKLGDSFRKVKSQSLEVNKKNDVEFTNRGLTNSVKDDKVEDYDSHSESIDVAGYGGSFVLKSAGFESQGENECSDSKDTLDSEYTADVCVSETRSPIETDISRSLEFLSSSEALPEGRVSQLEENLSSTNQPAPETSQVSPEVSGWGDVESERVSQEVEELTKDSPTTTDVVEAVEADEVSSGSDNSGQPSPISVLESSFEDSPGHVDFSTISSELEELRSHLRRLKWDDDDEHLEGLEETSDAVLDKEVVAEVPGQQELKLSSNTSELRWLQLERCDAKLKEDEQKVYVKNILLASGLIRNSDSNNFLVEQHSLSHALDPMLFEQLEGFYRTQSDRTDTAKASRLERRLLFDMVDEILSHKRVCDPWLATVRTVPGGGLLLRELWSKLSNFFDFPQGEDLQHTVENLIERYLTKGDRWMEITIYIEAIGVEVENELMGELFQECVEFL